MTYNLDDLKSLNDLRKLISEYLSQNSGVEWNISTVESARDHDYSERVIMVKAWVAGMGRFYETDWLPKNDLGRVIPTIKDSDAAPRVVTVLTQALDKIIASYHLRDSIDRRLDSFFTIPPSSHGHSTDGGTYITESLTWRHDDIEYLDIPGRPPLHQEQEE